jgi:hypothetical protein
MSDERPGSDPEEPTLPAEPRSSASDAIPARPDLDTRPGSPRAGRRRWPWIVVALVLTNTILVAFLLTRPEDPGIPDRIAGLPRLRTAQAKDFEDLLSGFRAGGISLRGGMYGTGDRPELILERFVGSDDPFQGIPIETVLGQAGLAFGQGLASGGEIDMEGTMSRTRDGVEYACAPYHGTALAAGDASIICIFAGRTSGILVDLRTSDTTSALGDAEAAYRAVFESS